MLGVVFTEFMDMVEDRFSADMVDDIIDDAAVSSGGAYTAVGRYDHKEMVALVAALSRHSGLAVDDLIHAFGHHLFGRFVERYPVFFSEVHSPVDFLMSVETHIHTEVRKLYPDAELPSIKSQPIGATQIEVEYASVRPFGILAQGLIEGAMRHFETPCRIHREILETGAKNRVRFVIDMS